MTDLTPSVHDLLREKKKQLATDQDIPSTTVQNPKDVNEFLKEAYRINSHIQSLLHYLQSIRHSYLSINTNRKNLNEPRATSPTTKLPTSQTLSDTDRDSIDSSTALLLRDLSSSISNLQSAEQLRQETERQLLNKKYGHFKGTGILWRWAAGESDTTTTPRDKEQIIAEETSRCIRMVRENVLWFLRRNLEQVAEVQRGMVEKRIERVREKEKSVLYKAIPPKMQLQQIQEEKPISREQQQRYEKASKLSTEETATIESQLSAEQLQLFAEENDLMLRHYEDTLSKVQNAEKSLLEISSLQQTLVSHLSTQEEYITQLVTDASTTAENVGKGNKELKRASERRSTAQMVFWCTAGLCVWLVVWDAIF
ncbi:SNARE protein (Ufe1), putative [Talaromyces stipitatus ATCC 10500]|uniref:SNARE protein (Ufe1), putative n=1 Tax=Talaromyces stipitatus (strain ATCC 10500 / CBS 375.48 / QM 6759 / NRRL 1006) TaxID=441959 RepID=B8MC92_TALSN|nr:SNARE protein (Ufe1), putative [Talaromyces stipitatus ATCC 10500]EED18538.1 SNARE protein (Ufe1), putative [Talaromyces stipitatus ATCC 10500]